MVSRPTYVGGLGFGMKWDMGWMHDTLRLHGQGPVHRKYHHDELTFRMLYAFTRTSCCRSRTTRSCTAKGRPAAKMPGDDWQKFANLRLLFGYMYGAAGQEAAVHGRRVRPVGGVEPRQQPRLAPAGGPGPRRRQRWVHDLNRLYRTEPALYEGDFDPAGFEWMIGNDADQGVFAFLRRDRARRARVLAVCHTSPVVRDGYRIGVPSRVIGENF